MLKSCLSLIVLALLAVLFYNLYRKSQQAEVEAPRQEGLYSPEFKRAVMVELEGFLEENQDIDRIELDGPILDIHYKYKVGKGQFRLDAEYVAKSFSNLKKRLVDNGDVTVRCISNSLIRLEATAKDGQLIQITEP